ncbi:MAG: hypothetical protein WC865_03175 [Bacteroidales bacterium]
MVLVFGLIFGLIYSSGFTFQDVFSQVITRLTPMPDIAIAEMIKTNTVFKDMAMTLPLWANLLLALGYGLIFYMITRAILVRRNL